MKRILGSLIAVLAVLASTAQTEFYFDTQNADDTQIQEYWYGFVANKGKKYNLIVEGTYSIWAPSFWTDPCGKPETDARYHSKNGAQTGTVGYDFEYTFALPNSSYCSGKTLPERTTRFEISLDEGKTWFHPVNKESFQANHVYNYEITGAGSSRIGVRQKSAENSDDYGKLRFILEPFPCDTPTVNLGPDQKLCPDEPITLNASTLDATYEWSDGSEDSVLQVDQPGVYFVRIETPCFYDRDTVVIGKVDFPFNPLGNDTTFCLGDTVVRKMSYSGMQYNWFNGSNDSIGRFIEGGNKWVDLSKEGCTVREEVNLRQIRAPEANLGEDVLLCEGADSYFKVEGDDLNVLWNDGSNEFINRFSDSGLYWVHLQNQCGFSADTALVEVSDCNCNYFVPSAFTPNNDNRNDVFVPVYNCDITSVNMQIFNRFGQVIYEENGQEVHWDGLYDSLLVEQESYFYIITVYFRTRQKITKSGVVTVIY